MFNHTSHNIVLPELETRTINDKRHYLAPNGCLYPSVTTVLSVLSKEAIEAWKDRIGHEQAALISEQAATRGTALHLAVETYLKNEAPVLPEDLKNPVHYMFNRLKRKLRQIDNIIGQEFALYSDPLALAGRCDCVADFNGVPSIIDFKTSNHYKQKDWILAYFLQATAYSLMFEERTGIKIEQIVILIVGQSDFSCQQFVEDRTKYIDQLKGVIAQYNQEQQ